MLALETSIQQLLKVGLETAKIIEIWSRGCRCWGGRSRSRQPQT